MELVVAAALALVLDKCRSERIEFAGLALGLVVAKEAALVAAEMVRTE
jgi:hypothetical protein